MRIGAGPPPSQFFFLPSWTMLRRRRSMMTRRRRPDAVDERPDARGAARARRVGQGDPGRQMPGFTHRRRSILNLHRVVGRDVVQAGAERPVRAQQHLVAAQAVRPTPPERASSGPAVPARSTRTHRPTEKRLVALEERHLLAGLDGACRRPGAPGASPHLAGHRLRRAVDLADAAALLRVDDVGERQDRAWRGLD